MSSMMRKLSRGIARTAMKADKQKLFKQYAPVDGTIKRYGVTMNDTVSKSYFAREWRNYL